MAQCAVLDVKLSIITFLYKSNGNYFCEWLFFNIYSLYITMTNLPAVIPTETCGAPAEHV